MLDADKSEEIIERLKALILLVEPQVAFVEKYGGVVAEASPGQPKSQFCGVFVYKSHVSLEFTEGARLDDQENILDGNGKHRRHIKVTSLNDIAGKRCEEFLYQAHKLRS